MDEQIFLRIQGIAGLQGMTVNERLWASGLMDEFDWAVKTDKSKAKKMLRWLKVDEASIEKIVKWPGTSADNVIANLLLIIVLLIPADLIPHPFPVWR